MSRQTKRYKDDPLVEKLVLELAEGSHADCIENAWSLADLAVGRQEGYEAVKAELLLAKRELKSLREKLGQIRATMPEIAAILASAGNLPHKEKNEAILRTVARLLALYESGYTSEKLDDIPF